MKYLNLLTSLIALQIALSGCEVACIAPRNPFGYEDIDEPASFNQMEAFLKTQSLGGPEDPNAVEWVPAPSSGSTQTLNGTWFGRRSMGSGIARFQEKDGRVFIRYTEQNGADTGATWLFEIQYQDEYLQGTAEGIKGVSGDTAWYGRIISPERIDGITSNGERWDFRRVISESPATRTKILKRATP